MKYFAWFGRDYKFHLTKEYPEDNPFMAFFICEVEANNEQEAEMICKQELKERFTKKEKL